MSKNAVFPLYGDFVNMRGDIKHNRFGRRISSCIRITFQIFKSTLASMALFSSQNPVALRYRTNTVELHYDRSVENLEINKLTPRFNEKKN